MKLIKQLRTTPPYFILGGLSLLTIALVLGFSSLNAQQLNQGSADDSSGLATAVFAGGCFWCMESDFDKLNGVKNVVSGYSGGSAETATYKQVSYENTGHFEVVEVSYDPKIVSYAELLEYYWRHVDPTDLNGQFCDKGDSYRTAIFYANDEEKSIIDASLRNLRTNKPFESEIVTEILPTKPFYVAEDHHQNYYQRNPIRYKYYRNGCRRDQRIEELWGDWGKTE